MVGVRGFEPPTPCSQSRCATRLRYTPTPGNPTITNAGPHAEPLTDIRDSLPLHLNQPETQGRALSISVMVSGFKTPSRRTSRPLSTERIWFKSTTESVVSPPSGARTRTSVG